MLDLVGPSESVTTGLHVTTTSPRNRSPGPAVMPSDPVNVGASTASPEYGKRVPLGRTPKITTSTSLSASGGPAGPHHAFQPTVARRPPPQTPPASQTLATLPNVSEALTARRHVVGLHSGGERAERDQRRPTSERAPHRSTLTLRVTRRPAPVTRTEGDALAAATEARFSGAVRLHPHGGPSAETAFRGAADRPAGEQERRRWPCTCTRP